jgi:hypothetical protein
VLVGRDADALPVPGDAIDVYRRVLETNLFSQLNGASSTSAAG